MFAEQVSILKFGFTTQKATVHSFQICVRSCAVAACLSTLTATVPICPSNGPVGLGPQVLTKLFRAAGPSTPAYAGSQHEILPLRASTSRTLASALQSSWTVPCRYTLQLPAPQNMQPLSSLSRSADLLLPAPARTHKIDEQRNYLQLESICTTYCLNESPMTVCFFHAKGKCKRTSIKPHKTLWEPLRPYPKNSIGNHLCLFDL